MEIPKTINKIIHHNSVYNNNFAKVSKDTDKKNLRVINYPGVLKNMYRISEFGKVYSVANDSYISWSIRGDLPYVNLSCSRDNTYVLEPFYIKDLVACSFIENSLDYLERGYRAANIDGNTMNCDYRNIIYLK